MKITIVGPSGGGKSTLARKISERFGVARLELDRLWFEVGGHDCFINGCSEKERNLVTETIRARVKEFLLENENWVIDGTYGKIQPLIADGADEVVLIRRPLMNRVVSHISRIIKNEWRHTETSRLQDFLFTKAIIRRWLRGENKKLEAWIVNYNDKLTTLNNFREIDVYFKNLTKKYEHHLYRSKKQTPPAEGRLQCDGK